MIGWLSGRLRHRGADHILIDVGGVGYVVFVSERTLMALPGLGEPVALHTEMVVREDLLQLFGFRTVLEREWHKLLTSVQGVGAKASMAILGTIGPEGIGRAIALGDASAVKAAPGIGPKIAARLINELRDKAPAVMAMGGGEAELLEPSQAPAAPRTAASGAPPLAETASGQVEALSALANLGYAPADAARAVAQASDDGARDTSALIKGALKRLAPQ